MAIKVAIKYWLIFGFVYIMTRFLLPTNISLEDLGLSLFGYIWGLINLYPVILKKEFYQPYSGILIRPGENYAIKLSILLLYIPLSIFGLFFPETMALLKPISIQDQ